MLSQRRKQQLYSSTTSYIGVCQIMWRFPRAGARDLIIPLGQALRPLLPPTYVMCREFRLVVVARAARLGLATETWSCRWL